VLPAADCPSRADTLLAVLAAQLPTGTEADPGAGVVQALQRVLRILPADMSEASDDPARLTEPTEVALIGVVADIEAAMAGQEGDLARLFAVSGAFPDAVNEFFETIRVLADDPAVRAARLGLLRRIVAVTVPEVNWNVLG
jgi:glycyl-tRNA synthetase